MSDHTTYATVSPLVVRTEDLATVLQVTFRCPATGTETSADGEWPNDGHVKREAKTAKRGLFMSIRNRVATEVRTAAGYSLVGRVAGEAAAGLAQNVGVEREYEEKRTDKDRERAVLAAFQRVRAEFAWDDATGRWVWSGLTQTGPSPFSALLTDHPVTEPYDRDVLAWLLASIVVSDGAVTDEERETFAALVPGADLDAFVARRPLSVVDFEETAQGRQRESLLLMGWVVALSDEQAAVAEQTLMAMAATGLGVAEPRASELRELAQVHVLEQAMAELYSRGLSLDDIRARAEQLGSGIGLGADAAARAVIRWSKRR